MFTHAVVFSGEQTWPERDWVLVLWRTPQESASMRWHKIEAKFYLAIGFLLHLMKRIFLFWKRPRGLKDFLSQYAADGIFPVTREERSRYPSFERCQACSLCTFSCEAIVAGRAPSAFEPKYILLSLGRSPHESEVFLEEWLPCYECEKCSVTCPNQVPVHEMAQEIIERRNRLGFRN